MGISLRMGFYSKECNNKKVLPYLDLDVFDMDINGKHMPDGFYESCHKLGNWDEDSQCWVFDDIAKLYQFASLETTPVVISDYISNYEFDRKEDDIFILWKR